MANKEFENKLRSDVTVLSDSFKHTHTSSNPNVLTNVGKHSLFVSNIVFNVSIFRNGTGKDMS